MHQNEEKSFDIKIPSEFANFLVNDKNITLNNEYTTESRFSINGWIYLVCAGLSSVLILFIFLLCRSCCKQVLSASRQKAYNNLVQHGFFKQWIIQDLSYLQYNPEGLTNN